MGALEQSDIAKGQKMETASDNDPSQANRASRWLRRGRTYVLIAGIVLAVYIISYGILASGGEYVFAQSGQTRWANTGLAVTDVIEWQPHSMMYTRYRSVDGKLRTRGNTLGYFYSPLVLLDRRFLHKTKSTIEMDLVEGGVYLIDSFSGTYKVAKVLTMKYGAVLYHIYENIYDEIPESVSPDELIVSRTDDGGWILCGMREELFKQGHLRFLFHEDLSWLEEKYVEQNEQYLKAETWEKKFREMERGNHSP